MAEEKKLEVTSRVTQEIVNTKFNAQLTALRYQEGLQSFVGWQVTSENVAETQERFRNLRSFIRRLGDIKDEGKRPALEEGRMWDAAYNSFLKPLQKALEIKEAELQVVVNKIAEENRLLLEERRRVEQIKNEINRFILQQSTVIAEATTQEELVSIEKIIGSHKGNKFRYQEFLPELVARCTPLTQLIKKQKDSIKEMELLKAKLAEAEAKGNDAVILETQEQQDVLQHTLNETKVLVQEEAINQATRPEEPTPVDAEPTEIKYRRQTWKWEIVDMKRLTVQHPDLVICTPDKEKIDALLADRKADGSLKGVDTLLYGGIRFYLEKKA